MEDPVNCDRCNASLERGYSQLYKGDTIVESICFDCDRKEILNRYIDNEILTSKIVTESILDECSIRHKDKRVLPEEIYDKIQNSRNNIDAEIKLWEKEVWFGGLQKTVQSSDYRGFDMLFIGGHVMVYSIAGRTMFTIENDKAEITLITAEDSEETVMGQQGIYATEKEAVELLRESRSAFKNGAQFYRKDSVGLGF